MEQKLDSSVIANQKTDKADEKCTSAGKTKLLDETKKPDCETEKQIKTKSNEFKTETLNSNDIKGEKESEIEVVDNKTEGDKKTDNTAPINEQNVNKSEKENKIEEKEIIENKDREEEPKNSLTEEEKIVFEKKKEWDCDFYSTETKIPKSPDLSKTLFIANLPKIPPEKSEKLKSVISKKLKTYGEISEVKIVFGQENSKLSVGAALVTFKSSLSATGAKNFTKFDKKHKVHCVLLKDYHELLKRKENVEKRLKEFSEMKGIPKIFGFNSDKRFRSQITLREKDYLSLYWMDPLQTSKGCIDPEGSSGNGEDKIVPLSRKEKITRKIFKWSPSGRHLGAISIDNKAVVFLSGCPLREEHKIKTKNCLSFEFSPKEKYVVTNLENNFSKIWDFVNYKCTAEVKIDSYSSLKWCHDDSHFAFLQNKKLKILNSQNTELLENEIIKTHAVESFIWAKDASLIALKIKLPERRTQISLLEVPSMVQKTSCVYYGNVSLEMKCFSGRLIVKVQTFTAKKNAKSFYFDFFDHTVAPCAKERSFAFSDLLADKKVAGIYPLLVSYAFSSDLKFMAGICTFNGEYTLSVFKLIGERVERQHCFRNEKTNSLFWSPSDEILTAVGISDRKDDCNGTIVFYDAKKKFFLAKTSHMGCNWGGWSPCGRYFVSAILLATGNRGTTGDSCFNIYNRSGDFLFSNKRKNLHQFAWRPRINPARNSDLIKEISDEIKEKFERSDERVLLENRNAGMAHSRDLLRSYFKMKKTVKDALEQEKQTFVLLMREIVDEEEEEMVPFDPSEIERRVEGENEGEKGKEEKGEGEKAESVDNKEKV